MESELRFFSVPRCAGRESNDANSGGVGRGFPMIPPYEKSAYIAGEDPR